MYCQKCGFQLEQIKLCAPLWIAFYRCEHCRQCYLEVADARWIYPLLFLEAQVLENSLHLSDEALTIAARKIKVVDYKTVSIVEFENALREIQ